MNFLAHAVLAGDDDADRIGGLLGDFVKGPLPAGLPPALAKGVALHRAIEFIVADPAATIEIVAGYVPELEPTFARQVLDATIPLYGTDWLALDSARWPEMYEFLLAHDLASPDADVDNAFQVLDWTP